MMLRPQNFNLIFLICKIYILIVTLNELYSISTDDTDDPSKNFVTNYDTEVVENEFIIVFDGYYKTPARKNFIAAALHDFDNSSWSILERSNPAVDYPSDFDVLVIREPLVSSAFEALTDHPAVKQITPQLAVHRTLLFVNSTNNTYNDDSKYKLNIGRKLLRAIPKPITSILEADQLWSLGITGKGVKVAIFDTGLRKKHPHFRNVIERTDWTDENTLEDNVGHGTFVAGVIASSKECLGLAPDADLYIFKVFTKAQISYTSWFLDAFNYAIFKKINVLNLSIGGPDFMDQPFVDKVWELTANGVIMISAIGNSGPQYGSLNNPGDQMDVIGVGGINYEDEIAKFSSRGMTTWELPQGYGRVKPDIVAYGDFVTGSDLMGGCRALSGTSVSSPVVTGAVTLLLSGMLKAGKEVNPGSMKQALMESAERLNKISMFEQGHGKLNILRAYQYLKVYSPKASLSPSYIDLSECQYMWPYCTQPIFYSGMPTIVNVTVINGMDVVGYIKQKPRWYPYVPENGQYLNISVTHSDIFWPWSGWIAVSISVKKEAELFNGVANGHLEIVLQSPGANNSTEPQISVMKLLIKTEIIQTPPRSKRIIWDQFHNLRYPSGYFPKDNLKKNIEPLDWRGDHIHTNFKDMYEHLRNVGYFIDVLGYPFTCFNAKYYGTLIIVDPEEEFFPEEIMKLKNDVEKGLSVVIFADWYNTTVMQRVKFFDENTRQWWTPNTGGSNIPALNDLLSTWSIAFGDQVYDGSFSMLDRTIQFSSGSILVKFPSNGIVIAKKLKDQGIEIIDQNMNKFDRVPVLGLLQTNDSEVSGRVIVYGDSNCLDGNNNINVQDCFWLLDAILQYAATAHLSLVFREDNVVVDDHDTLMPKRLKESNLFRYSKVLENNIGSMKIRPLLTCPGINWLSPIPVNETLPDELFVPHILLWMEIQATTEQIQKQENWMKSLNEGHYFLLYSIILLSIGALFVIFFYCKCGRTRRRPVARLQKFFSALNARRTLSV